MKNLLSLCAFLCALTCFSQPNQHFYGSPGKDFFHQIVPAPDGNYFLLGSKTGLQYNQIWLTKITAEGDVIWEKTYSASGADELGNRLTILADGNLLISGQQRIGGVFEEGSALILKTDANGNQLWKHGYDDTLAAFDAVPVGSNFLVVGAGDTPGASSPGFLMMINATGGMVWKLPINVSSQTYVKRIFPTADGNFLLAGRANVIGVGFWGIFLQKIEPDGSLIWETAHWTNSREEDHFGSNEDFHPQPLGAVQLADGSIWLTNSYHSAASDPNSDIALLHFSPEGVLLEEKIYGGALKEEPYGLSLLPDGGWLISGFSATDDNPALYNGFALRTNSNGLQVWRKYYGLDAARDRLFGNIALPSGDFLLAGMSNAPAGGGTANSDGWLIRADADGNTLPWRINGKIVIDTNGDCVANPGEPVATGWFVKAANAGEQLLVTDADGNFKLNTADGINSFVVVPPTLPGWTICNNNQSVSSNAANPAASLTFVAQQTGGECALTEVSMTQPDLVRCSTSHFFVTVSNRGAMPSDNLELAVELHPDMHLIAASAPFTQSGNRLVFQLSPIQGLQSRVIEIRVSLTCDVQIGATHPVVARVSPVECAPAWSGPKYTVEGSCDGTTARFELKNSGGGGPNAATRYRVMADDLLAADWTEIILAEGSTPHVLSFPADGRTWRVELEQAPGYPLPGHPAASLERCGTGANWMHSISYLDAWRPDDDTPEVSWMLPANTTNIPDKVAGAVHGFGLYNLIGDLRPLEFTARARNPLPHPAQKATFHLAFSPTLDVATFRVLSANAIPTAISIAENREIQVVLENIQLDTGAVDQADALVRFAIEPFPDTPADSAAASNFLVQAKAYFNDIGPVDLAPAFLNYSRTFPVAADEYNNYPPEIERFGARGFTFGSALAPADDGSVFLVGESTSYSEGTHMDALIVKTDPYGRVYWLNAIDLGDGGENSCRGVAPLNDGGCLIAGNYRRQGVENYLLNNYAYVARLDDSGNLLWHKKFRPSGEDHGVWTNGILATDDDNFVLFGYTANSSLYYTEQFYLKLSADGDVIWQRYEEISGSSFKPIKGILTPDGGIVFAGPNERTDFDTDIYLEKIDADGNKVWDVSYLPEDYTSDYDYGLAMTPDGGFMFSGYTQWEIMPGDYGTTPIFIKYTANGVLEWIKKPVIGPFALARTQDIIAAPGGGFLVGGEIYADNDLGVDVLLLKIDENAEPLWWRNYGTKNSEQATSLIVSAPDQVLLWGFNQSRPPLWDLRALLVHTDLEGNLITGMEETPVANNHQTLLFPNPASGMAHVVLSPMPSHAVDWMVVNLSGQIVQRGSSADGLFTIDATQLAVGLYIVAFPGGLYPPQRLVVSK